MSASVDHLAATWTSLDALCSDFSDADWNQATGCPGWTVQDVVSHLVDYESRAIGRPAPEHVPADLSHAKNPIGESNEVGVDYRRARSGAEVLDEFREVTAERLAELRALTDEDLKQETLTPAGPGTVADMLTLRVMDTWSHEQDIRRAVGRPGHVDGPVVDEAVEYFSRFLPYVVGKRAGAPDGSSVVFVIGDVATVAVEVVDGRGRLAAAPPGSPTTVLQMPVATFAALVGGRSDAPDDVEIGGDAYLGRRVVAGMGFMP